MTTSPYDTLPTGKQALASASSESIEEKSPIPGNSAAPMSENLAAPINPASSAKAPAAVSRQSAVSQAPAANRSSAVYESADAPHNTQAPNPITDPYGGYEEISLEEAARLAAPAITPSQGASNSPAASKGFSDPVSAKPAATQQTPASNTAVRETQAAAASGNSASAAAGNSNAAISTSDNFPAATGSKSHQVSDKDTIASNRIARNQRKEASADSESRSAGLDDSARGNLANSSQASSGSNINTTGATGTGITGTVGGSAASSAEAPLETELHYDNVRLRNLRRTWEYMLPFEETLLVPDTMPDMIQILFSEGRAIPSQPGKTHYSSSDTYSGEVLLFTVYRPDNDTETPVDVVRSTITFETTACWGASGTQNASAQQPDSDRIYYAIVRLKEAEPSRLNERKFQVRGKLCITVTEIQKAELHVLRDASDKDLILKQEKMEAADLVFETEEFADMEQEIAVEEGQPQPAKILKESFTITETHRQIASGKLIVNGLLKTQILYLGEDDEGEDRVCCRSEKTEFTQFIPLQNQLDSDLIKVDFSSDGLKLTIENQDTFQLEGQVRIQIHGYANKQIPVASDAYHKEKAIHFDREGAALSCLSDVLSGEISAREVVSLTEQDQHPDKLICGNILPCDIAAHPEHGRIVIEGSVPVRILALDENGRAFVIESEVPLRGALDTSAAAEALNTADLFACSAIKDFWIDSINSRQIEINVSATIEVWISGNREFTSLEHFTAKSEAPQQPAMAIYITSAGDSLWDIAKHYQCDTDALVQLNEIDGDAPLAEGTKLLIVR